MLLSKGKRYVWRRPRSVCSANLQNLQVFHQQRCPMRPALNIAVTSSSGAHFCHNVMVTLLIGQGWVTQRAEGWTIECWANTNASILWLLVCPRHPHNPIHSSTSDYCLIWGKLWKDQKRWVTGWRQISWDWSWDWSCRRCWQDQYHLGSGNTWRLDSFWRIRCIIWECSWTQLCCQINSCGQESLVAAAVLGLDYGYF